MKLYKSKKLLNIDNNAKTIKGQKYKVMTAILYLAPAKLSGFNTCAFSDSCALTCLNTAGRGQMGSVQQGRINKTLWYFKDRATFKTQLIKEIYSHVKRCKRLKYKPAIRLNGTSDINFENLGVMQLFKNITFYDYTKIPNRMFKFLKGQLPKNYHLTFSLGSTNKHTAQKVLKLGGNVATVFRNKKLPKKFMGHKVFNADKSDLRFRDPKNIIAGLYAKGHARHDNTGFVQDV